MKTITNKITILIFFTLPFFAFGQGQPFLSENWSQQGGEMAMFYRNATTTDSQRNVYVAGATINANGNDDILIQKFNPKGALIWEESFNGQANMDDMASDIFVDAQHNVYVTGTSVANQSNSYDLVVLKYNPNGNLLWTRYYNYGGSPIPKDAGTAITGDNNGNIYVTGSSYGNGTLADYITIRLDANNGSPVWEKRYEYAHLNEVPAKIEYKGGNLYVSGASQVSNNKWDLATVFYNAISGQQLGVRRSIGSATQGVNEIYDLTTDSSGNIYLTGAVNNQNSGYDIAVYKLDPQINLLWEKYYDENNGDDRGKGIKVDAQGNVYVAGYVTTASEGTNFELLKYNSSGQLLWNRDFNGKANQDDKAVQLVLDNQNHIFVTGTAYNSNKASFETLMYNTNGDLITQANLDNKQKNEKPTNITIDLAGDIVVVGQIEIPNGHYRTRTVKYSFYKKPINPVIVNGNPKYNANEVIIRFNKGEVNTSAINRKGFSAGILSDFIKPNALTAMSNKLGIEVNRLPTFKIFRRMTTADSLSITRLVDTIKVQPFWATLSVIFPQNYNIDNVIDSLNTLNDIILYSEPNYLYHLTSIPNDPIYSNLYPDGQSGLYNSIYGINLENAWNKQVGQSYVKVGVFGTGVNWRHEDFGNGTWTGSKIAGGYDYYNYEFPQNETTPDASGHGTAVAGIIGAIRNNSIGIAGIAGGNAQNNSTGVKLYSMKIAQTGNGDFISNSDVASAIVEGAIDNPNSGYGYGLNIENHSWGGDDYSVTIANAVLDSYRNGCIFVASSGNTSNSEKQYPASYNDSWVLKVGASDETGGRADFSTYGSNLDFIAPGTKDIYASLDNDNNSGYSYNEDGTSFACPTVSGVVALMYSQHNPLTNSEYPNNLSTEDVEAMLQKFATGVTTDVVGQGGLPVPNAYAGYGRINAGKTLDRISLPYRIRHYKKTVSTSSATLYASNQTVLFPEGIPGLAQSEYVSSTDIYKLEITVNYNLPSNENYLDGWVRNSACKNLYNYTNTIPNPYWSGVKMISSDQNSATFVGYLYKAKIYNLIGQHVDDRWFPVDLNSTAEIAFSIYTIDDNPNASIKENGYNKKHLKIIVFPNPSSKKLHFRFKGKTNKINVSVFDITGRCVGSYEYSNIIGSIETKSIDISNLSEGLYLIKFKADKSEVTRKFIKR